MLTVQRKVDEKITIYFPASTESREITVQVKAASRGRALIGIHAPKDCIILRSELQKREPTDEKA